MNFAGKIISGLMAAVYAMFIVALPTAPKPDQTPKTTVYGPATTHYSPARASNTTTPATGTPLPAAGDCDAWTAVGYGLGWPAVELDTLRLAMRLESGCNPQAVGDHGDSIGLMQIHCPTWGTPNKAWPEGWIQHYRFGTCRDLLDPIVNLKVGLAIWEGWAGSTPGWQHWHALP